MNSQEKLEQIFRTVDVIKDSLNNAKQVQVLDDNAGIKIETIGGENLRLKFDATKQTLKKQIGKGSFETICNCLTGLYFNAYMESKSILYRVEFDGKEQVRGYLFLENLQELTEVEN